MPSSTSLDAASAASCFSLSRVTEPQPNGFSSPAPESLRALTTVATDELTPHLFCAAKPPVMLRAELGDLSGAVGAVVLADG
jgi:hypothetical protein